MFIDEMPWMDSGRSNFVVALENFWNGWAMSRENVMMIATGSATSWMRDKLVGNKGGLHARVTCQLHLVPFTLRETEKYLENRGMFWDRYQILQSYMLLGGVPYYYSILAPEKSLMQNIDLLCFRPDGKLRIEFDELYNALFSNADYYIDTVKVLSAHKSGLTFQEIAKEIKLEGGKLTRVLKILSVVTLSKDGLNMATRNGRKYFVLRTSTLCFIISLSNRTTPRMNNGGAITLIRKASRHGWE